MILFESYHWQVVRIAYAVQATANTVATATCSDSFSLLFFLSRRACHKSEAALVIYIPCISPETLQ